MIKVLIGALFMATTALAQNTPTPSDQKRAGVAERPTGSTESTTRSKSTTTAAKSKDMAARPLPQPSMKEKLESGDNAIPSYKQEKDAGVHKTKPKYSPRQTPASPDVNAMSRKKS